MLSIFDLLHELIWKVIPEIIRVIPFHVPALARAVSWLAWDVLLPHGTGLHLFSLLSLFWQKRRTLAISGPSSREGDLTAGTAKAFYLDPQIWLGQSVAVNERILYWNVLLVWGWEIRGCPETVKHWLWFCPCYWQHYCFLGLKALKFTVFFSWCCRFGAMFWSFVRERWRYRGGKRLGLHRILTLTRGRSTKQLSGTPEGKCVSKRNFDPSFARCPCRCGKCKLLNMFSEFTKYKVEREVHLLSWAIWM